MNSDANTTVTASGVRVNNDSLAALQALRAARPAVTMCDQHRAFEADNCPSCGTSRMSR